MLNWLIKKVMKLFKGAKRVGPTIKKMASDAAEAFPEDAQRAKAWWSQLPEWLRIVVSVLWASIDAEQKPATATG